MLAAAFLRGSDAFDLLAYSFNPQSRILDGWGSLFVGFECEGERRGWTAALANLVVILRVARRPLAGTRVVWVARIGAKNHDG